ncbi:hypothetical protein RKD40_007478 [Streptomyces ambofaciens]
MPSVPVWLVVMVVAAWAVPGSSSPDAVASARVPAPPRKPRRLIPLRGAGSCLIRSCCVPSCCMRSPDEGWWGGGRLLPPAALPEPRRGRPVVTPRQPTAMPGHMSRADRRPSCRSVATVFVERHDPVNGFGNLSETFSSRAGVLADAKCMVTALRTRGIVSDAKRSRRGSTQSHAHSSKLSMSQKPCRQPGGSSGETGGALSAVDQRARSTAVPTPSRAAWARHVRRGSFGSEAVRGVRGARNRADQPSSVKAVCAAARISPEIGRPLVARDRTSAPNSVERRTRPSWSSRARNAAKSATPSA